MSRREGKYLEECGSACPGCGEPHPRRVLDKGCIRLPGDRRPEIAVACYCSRCGAEWTEGYRLESMEITIQGDPVGGGEST